jgi:hypothetical protein
MCNTTVEQHMLDNSDTNLKIASQAETAQGTTGMQVAGAPIGGEERCWLRSRHRKSGQSPCRTCFQTISGPYSQAAAPAATQGCASCSGPSSAPNMLAGVATA